MEKNRRSSLKLKFEFTLPAGFYVMHCYFIGNIFHDVDLLLSVIVTCKVINGYINTGEKHIFIR